MRDGYEPPRTVAGFDDARLAGAVLARVAVERSGIGALAVSREIGALLPADGSAPGWRTIIDAVVDRLIVDGLLGRKGRRLVAKPDGVVAAARFLDGRLPAPGAKPRPLPRTWREARDVRMVARMTGCSGTSPAIQRALLKIGGLRSAVLAAGFSLARRDAATPAKLRAAIAVRLLTSAATARSVVKSSKSARAASRRVGRGKAMPRMELSPSAGLALCSTLLPKGSTATGDVTAMSALAARLLGSATSDVEGLRHGLLAAFLRGGSAADIAAVGRAMLAGATKARGSRSSARGGVKRRATADARPTASSNARPTGAVPRAPTGNEATGENPARPAHDGRPASAGDDLRAFVRLVNVHAADVATGWSGDRKAFISHVWRSIRESAADARLSEADYKAGLLAAHRAGLLSLAFADLKDKSMLADVHASAVQTGGAVWHYVRVAA